MTDETDSPDTPSVVLVRVGRLNTLRSVRRELGRLYVDLRYGRVPPKIAGTGAYLLTGMIKALEVELLEARIERLEERAELTLPSSRAPQRVIGHG